MKNIVFTDDSVKRQITDSISENLTDLDLESKYKNKIFYKYKYKYITIDKDDLFEIFLNVHFILSAVLIKLISPNLNNKL